MALSPLDTPVSTVQASGGDHGAGEKEDMTIMVTDERGPARRIRTEEETKAPV
jgi:hypothetical protein